MKSNLAFPVVMAILVLGVIFIFRGALGGGANTAVAPAVDGSNVTVVDGQQIVTITVKGGYQPQTTVVQAGLPTTLRFVTSGTYDCSSSMRIPSLNISKNLPATGQTDVDLGVLSAGTVQGTCSMGMYRFTLTAQG